jgi:hypothetical protein
MKRGTGAGAGAGTDANENRLLGLQGDFLQAQLSGDPVTYADKLSGQGQAFDQKLSGQGQAFDQGPAFDEANRQFQEQAKLQASQQNISRDMGLLDAALSQQANLGRLQLDANSLANAQYQSGQNRLEGARQFDISTTEGQRQFNDQLTEQAGQFRATEDRNRAGLAEAGRQFGVTEGRLLQGQAVDTANSMSATNLANQKFIAEILRNPADYLARAFSQRGGTSPTAEVTQADLINNLQGELNRIAETSTGMMSNGSIDPNAGRFQASSLDQMAALELTNAVDSFTKSVPEGVVPTIQDVPQGIDPRAFYDQWTQLVSDASDPDDVPNYTIPELLGTSPRITKDSPPLIQEGDVEPAAPPVDPPAASPGSGESTEDPDTEPSPELGATAGLGLFERQYPNVSDPGDNLPYRAPSRLSPDPDTNAFDALGLFRERYPNVSDPGDNLPYRAPSRLSPDPVDPNTNAFAGLGLFDRQYPNVSDTGDSLPYRAPSRPSVDPNTNAFDGAGLFRERYPTSFDPGDSSMGFNQGGATREPQFLVGDKPGGQYGPQTEMILNPTGAPLSVVPRNQLPQQSRLMPGFALGTLDTQNTGVVGPQQTTTAPNYTDTQPLPPPTQAAPQAPQVPQPTTDQTSSAIARMIQTLTGPTNNTQTGIQNLEQQFRPPAVNDVYQGRNPGRLNLDLGPGGVLPSPQMLANLTQDDAEALRTTLASKNMTIEDYLQVISQRFGRTRNQAKGRLMPR